MLKKDQNHLFPSFYGFSSFDFSVYVFDFPTTEKHFCGFYGFTL